MNTYRVRFDLLRTAENTMSCVFGEIQKAEDDTVTPEIKYEGDFLIVYVSSDDEESAINKAFEIVTVDPKVATYVQMLAFCDSCCEEIRTRNGIFI